MKITRMLAFSAVPFAASISESWPALAQLKSTLWWAASTPPWKPGRPAARLPKNKESWREGMFNRRHALWRLPKKSLVKYRCRQSS